MAAPRGTPACWHFDSVTVDTATFRVLVKGAPRALEPKSFRLLQFLIEHRERVVSKEEIFQAVWAGTSVADNALTRAVAQIRKAIGDDPRQPRYIETVPTVGCRFVATVSESAVAPIEPVGDPEALYPSPFAVPRDLALSADGKRLAFTAVLSNSAVLVQRRQVYLQETATGARRLIASGPEDIGFPRFSRDDKWIGLEITHRPRGGDDIAVMPASGEPAQVVLKSDQPSYAAGWMPDNDRILFAGFRDGAWNIYTVSRTSGRTERLTSYTSTRTYVRYPDWLTGDRIVYEFNETKGNIFVATLPR